MDIFNFKMNGDDDDYDVVKTKLLNSNKEIE